jgi:hypothetical protein
MKTEHQLSIDEFEGDYNAWLDVASEHSQRGWKRFQLAANRKGARVLIGEQVIFEGVEVKDAIAIYNTAFERFAELQAA